MRPYVSTALLAAPSPARAASAAPLSPARAITGAEAAAMLNNVLG
jgi:hypothetical protein